MRRMMTGALMVALVGSALAAGAAQAGPLYGERVIEGPAVSTAGGRAPWNQAWEYDSGSGNDRRPELPYYQQGRGQQTGGPARNLLPDDRLRLFPY
ncbi:hypothetical protein [Methylobacterium sp. Leaf118]|uniref:hypothetical protein n=1 Tax=Methylobacterium sp. Leaf118 TaxID=2876562 RepID=UPI001E45B39C|nr:hypothetical protein [Methylobacterium sp. Leaf118]